MYLSENKIYVPDNGPFEYDREITLTIRRLDQVDPVTGGNKWYKLKYNIDKFKKGEYSGLLTFGGAWSNHLAATARAGKLLGISTVGIVRGEEPDRGNITLTRAARDGMKLIFVSRKEYRERNNPDFFQNLIPEFKSLYIVPEGGSNLESLLGCREILDVDDKIFTDIIVACGTGTTAAGMITTLQPGQHLTGISVLKDGGSVERNILGLLRQYNPGNVPGTWHIEHGFHGGGYAKSSNELKNFINQFEKSTGIKTEPVYSGKLFYAIENLIASGKFNPGSRLLAIHTGGLQYLAAE